MAAFEFRALDQKGRQQKGVMEADSARQIRQQLRDKGLGTTCGRSDRREEELVRIFAISP